jgi:hypothetical protein
VVPPTFEDLAEWAGKGRVVRADPAAIADWLLLEHQKFALVKTGVPLIGEGIVDVVTFTEVVLGDGRAGYQLAMSVNDERPGRTTIYSADPGSGQVWETCRKRHRFVNSSIIEWQCSLHLVGAWLTTSTVIHRWDEDGDSEHAALAELAALRGPHKGVRPSLLWRDGHHDTHYWPAVLDRWLYRPQPGDLVDAIYGRGPCADQASHLR